MKIKSALVKLLLLTGLAVSSLAHAEKMYSINIAMQSMPEALTQLSKQTDIQVIFPYQLAKDKTANAVNGRFSVEHALALLLEGTGLSGGLSKKNVLMISPLSEGSSNDYFNGEDMMNRKKNILASTIAFFMGSGVLPGMVSGVLAEELGGAKADTIQVEEIIVTAQKREQRLIDVPISIAVLGEEKLKDMGINGLNDLSYAVPNLSIRSSSDNNHKIIIRGISNGTGN